MIMFMLGGMRMPSVPPAQTDPRSILSLYPLAIIVGIATTPSVAAVATLDPEVAAIRAQAPILVCKSPPGRRDSQRDSE